MSAAEHFDGIIIGTGQAGKPLAGALAAAGWRIAIVESGRVGGTCVIDGCTPSKTMIASARVAHMVRRAEAYGVKGSFAGVDLAAVRERKRSVVDMFSDGSEKGLQRHETLELIFGKAFFSATHQIEVQLNEGGVRYLEAPAIFINAGGRPAVPPIPGLDGVDFLDSTSIMELGELPAHLLVLGGGVIGVEFAQMFHRFGAEVTIVERAPQLLEREDADVAGAVGQILRDEGVSVHTSASVTRFQARDDGSLTAGFRRNGVTGETGIDASHLLVATGRTPNSDSLALDAAGIEVDAGGYIKVDERLETRVRGVYALGDIAGTPPFTHMAYDDYRVVRANLLDGGGRTTQNRLLPYTVFIDPPLGRVGLTEREAREKGLDIRVARLPMSRVARAIEAGETLGLMKAVVDARTDRILGATVLGIDGGEVVAVLQAAMMGQLRWQVLRDGIFSHPTTAESLNNLFMTLDG